MELVLSKNAAKQFYKLPKIEQPKVKKKLLLLTKDPLVGKKLAGELAIYRSFRAWPYRIIYQINKKAKVIEVSEILHRQGAYN